MGNAHVGVSDRLQGVVKAGQTWVEMCVGTNVRQINAEPSFSVDPENTYDTGTRFEIELLCAIPETISLIFLFPRNERIVHTRSFGSIEALNKSVNTLLALETTDPGRKNEAQLGICWLDCIYNVTGMRHGTKDRFYLLWANQISIYDSHDREIPKTGDMPVIVVTNGHFGILSVYPLVDSADARFINPKQIQWVPPVDYPMFTCDVPLPARLVLAQSNIVKMNTDEAKVRRERTILPEHEVVSTPSQADCASLDYDEDSHLATGAAAAATSGMMTNRSVTPLLLGTATTDEEQDEETDDAANEFFSSALSLYPGEHTEDRVTADVKHAQVVNALVSESSEEAVFGPNDMAPSVIRFTTEPLTSPSTRGRVPVKMLSRGQHRSSIDRIRVRRPSISFQDGPRTTRSQSSASASDTETPRQTAEAAE